MEVLFNHELQHGPDSIDKIEKYLNKSSSSLDYYMILAEEMVAHGHINAPFVIKTIRNSSSEPLIISRCNDFYHAWRYIRNNYKLEEFPKNILDSLYKRNGFSIAKHKNTNKKLLVIFTTVFNNFYISSPALMSIIQSAEVDILFLKDATRYNYHRGVEGFASDLPGIAESITSLAERIGAERIYVSGFSSGGYAALLTSLLLPECHGYLGFSHRVDVSPNSLLQQSSIMSQELKDSLDQDWFLDLRSKLEIADREVPRTLVYGALNACDVAHAQHLEGLDTIRLICLPDTGHNTILKLLASQQLGRAFDHLVNA